MTTTPSSVLEHLCNLNDVGLDIKYEARGQSHQPRFTVTVQVKGYEVLSASAEGVQKKQAKHKACNKVLKLLKENKVSIGWTDLHLIQDWDCQAWDAKYEATEEPVEDDFNYIGALTEWSSRQGFINPYFESRDIPHVNTSPILKEFQVDCIIYNMTDDDGNFLTTKAVSGKKQLAKRMAAAKMFNLLQSKGIDVLARSPAQEVAQMDHEVKPNNPELFIPEDIAQQLETYAQNNNYSLDFEISDADNQVTCVAKAIPSSGSSAKEAHACHETDTKVAKALAAQKLLQLLTTENLVLCDW